MIYRTTGTGKFTYYVFAESLNLGVNVINIKITESESQARSNTLIGIIKADSMADAKALFRVKNLIY